MIFPHLYLLYIFDRLQPDQLASLLKALDEECPSCLIKVRSSQLILMSRVSAVLLTPFSFVFRDEERECKLGGNQSGMHYTTHSRKNISNGEVKGIFCSCEAQ